MGSKVSWSVFVVGRGTGGEERPNNHSLLVMALAVLSLIRGTAYLASPPIRGSISMALILNQAEWRLPFKLYLSSPN